MSREWKAGDVALCAQSVIPGTGTKSVILRTRKGWLFVALDGSWWHVTGDGAETVTSSARPLLVIDPEDAATATRLVEAWHEHLGDRTHVQAQDEAMQAALRSLLEPPKPRCVAHGNEECPECSRIQARHFAGGECTRCGEYGNTGMHWDTCAARIRGPVFASRDEAMGVQP